MTARVVQYVAEAAEAFETTPAMIHGPRRLPHLCAARRAVWKRLRDDGFSLLQIGQWTNRDHTTVLHGLRQA